MNALSYIIRYLQCLLVNFQATIYKNPHLAKWRTFWACRANHHYYNWKISSLLWSACRSPENLFYHNKKVIKTWTFCYISKLISLVKLFHLNSIISVGLYGFSYQSIFCCQPLFLISLKFLPDQLFLKQLHRANGKTYDLVFLIKFW